MPRVPASQNKPDISLFPLGVPRVDPRRTHLLRRCPSPVRHLLPLHHGPAPRRPQVSHLPRLPPLQGRDVLSLRRSSLRVPLRRQLGQLEHELPHPLGPLCAVLSPHVGSYDAFITASGDSFPVYTPACMSELFAAELEGRNVVTASWGATGFRPTRSDDFPERWHKRSHYGDAITLNVTGWGAAAGDYGGRSGAAAAAAATQVVVYPHFGSQWVFLTPSFVSYVSGALSDPGSVPSQLRSYLVSTGLRISDETFLPTILMNHPEFKATVPDVPRGDSLAPLGSGRPGTWMYAARYERMDEDRPGPWGGLATTQRYAPGAAFEDNGRPWGPYFLGAYDLRDIKRSGCLFFRKVSDRVEGNLYKVFPKGSRKEVEDIPDFSWSEEVAYRISDMPNFR